MAQFICDYLTYRYLKILNSTFVIKGISRQQQILSTYMNKELTNCVQDSNVAQ